ncbi:MAG: Hpt domain-containing protein [Oscillospiraceae bacterium]|nr:Hpt domain-containing protein [Oscillospiraceae bacterium]
MMTIESLRAFGADVDAGLVRCLNKEDFYLMLVKKAAEDTKLSELAEQLRNGQLDAAFETAHALKGMYANLSLTPLTEPVSEMTELLRKRTDTDYSALMQEAQKQYERLCSL